MKEVRELSKILFSFKLNVTETGKSILAKHKLSELEVSCTETLVKQSFNDALSNFQYIKDSLKGNNSDILGINFGLARLKCFQFECNALYYAALEGLCSFPIESLTIYYEMSPSWENLPKGITLRSMNKEGFKMKQEFEFERARQCIDSAGEMIENYDDDVDNIVAGLKRQCVNFFIAGAKSLQQERDIFAGVINILQSKWRPLGIDVNSYSYQNFPREVNGIPHQEQYNNFIAKHVNVAVLTKTYK